MCRQLIVSSFILSFVTGAFVPCILIPLVWIALLARANMFEKKWEESKGCRYQYGLLHLVVFAARITRNDWLGAFYEIVDHSEMTLELERPARKSSTN